MAPNLQSAPYGTWHSPITADLITGRRVGLSSPHIDGGDVYWIENRPEEAGRSVIVRRSGDGAVVDAIPAGFNARTRVHEYGGGAYAVRDGVLIFSNFYDTRLYRVDGDEPAAADHARRRAALRGRDLRPGPGPAHRRARGPLAAGGEAVNTIVALDSENESEGEILASGADFYANPRLSPDGRRLAWLQWNHPNMPWDGSELWVAELDKDGEVESAARDRGRVPPNRSSSRNGPPTAPSTTSPTAPAGGISTGTSRAGTRPWPRWKRSSVCRSGSSAWRPMPSSTTKTIFATYTKDGAWHLATIDTASGEMTPIASPYTEIDEPFAAEGTVVFVAGSPTLPSTVVRYDPAREGFETLKRSLDAEIDPGYLSVPEPVEFPTEDGLTAHAFLYLPRNKDFAAPDDELPPLLVQSHGGPTGATSTSLNLGTQFWTSRGFAVLDVNYGGSTGYGRAYTQRLNDKWGIVDVDDHVNGAKYLIERGLVDPERTAIRGWSASGYTTLATLAFRDLFRAGASHFGISDLETMTTDTHKFESRYLDGLIGPYPDRKDIYVERSPIHHLKGFTEPLILFQGSEDTVVPPDQAETLYEAMKARGLPVAMVIFEGEGHGFRRAENIRRALEGELDFYGQVFGFTPAGEIEPVQIANLKVSG